MAGSWAASSACSASQPGPPLRRRAARWRVGLGQIGQTLEQGAEVEHGAADQGGRARRR